MKYVRAVLSALGLILALPAFGKDVCANRVGMALILAVDSSQSIKESEWQLQLTGYVDAFRDQEIIDAILASQCGKIAVTVVVWSDRHEQMQTITWSILDSPETIEAFTRRLAAMNRYFNNGTSISGAIRHSLALFPLLNYKTDTRVIDISGDGPDDADLPTERRSSVPPPLLLKTERARAIAEGVAINGVSIFDTDAILPKFYNIHEYYRQRVVTPDGFSVEANGFADFSRAIRKKLVMEIASQ